MKGKFKFLLAAIMLLTMSFPTLGQTRATASINFSQQGYTNAQVVETANIDDNVSVVFSKGTNSNAPKYYNTGTSVRCYGGNSFTVSSTSGSLTEISLTFGSGESTNPITTDVETFQTPVWTGSASSVTFSIGGTTGHRRIMAISATYGSEPTGNVATPVFTPAEGNYTETQHVSITCATEGATIYYTTDGTAPAVTSTVYSAPIEISASTTLKAMAAKSGMENSGIATATYTFPTFLTIAEARALTDNSYAMVNGVVTFIDGRNIYIEDGTGGIDLYLNANTVPSSLALGDNVNAYGKKTTYNGLVELTGINGGNASEFSITGTGFNMPLAFKTIEEILAGANGSLQARRVFIENAIIGAISTSGNTTLTQGNDVINIYKIPALTGISEGDHVNVTAIIGYFNAPQLRVALASDVELAEGPQPQETVATPTFTPEAGTYTSAQNISITCATEGATIYYTTDGTNPTVSSTVYTNPIEISTSSTVKAMAAKAGMNNSDIAEAVYTIEMQSLVFNKIPSHSAVTSTDTYMIVDVTTGKALTWTKGATAAPTAVAVTIANNQISCSDASLFWKFEAVEGGYIIHPSTDERTWLYTTTSNNGIRIGTGDNKIWTLDVTDTQSSYHGFKNVATGRYMGVYNNQDWRSYTTIHANIKETQIEIFVLGEAPTPVLDPEFTVSATQMEGFTYEQGEGPSAAKTFTVSGKNLTENIVVSTTENFEISLTENGTYTSSLALTPSETGTIEATSIYVRLTAGLARETYTGQIEIAYTGMQPKSIVLSGNVTISNAVATPTFTPVAGTYITMQQVVIATETEGATIYYTTNGDQPTTSSDVYSTPITVNANTTIKAIAVKENYNDSETATANYAFPQLMNIAEARALTNNEYAYVEGVVTFIDGRNIYVQDATAGIVLYLNNNTVPANLAIGDEVRAYGKKTVYNGLTELTGIDGNVAFVITSSGNELPLANVTIAEIMADFAGSNALQSTRVAIENAVIGAINTNGNTPITQGNNSMNIYRIPAVEGMLEGDWVNVTGIIGCFNTPQMRVESAEDIEYTHRPTVTTLEGTVSGMTYAYGEGPSDIEMFHLTGSFLADNIYIFPSSSFEISTAGGAGFNSSSPATIIPPMSGQFNGIKVYCRLKEGLEIGTYNELQTIVSRDADTLFIRLIGTVTENGGDEPDNYVRIANLNELTDGSHVIIAARYDANENNYVALKNTYENGKFQSTEFTSTMADNGEILPASITDLESSYYWTVNVNRNSYSFTNANGDVLCYASGTNFSFGGDKNSWTITYGTSDAEALVASYDGFLIKNADNDTRAFAINSNFHSCGAYSTSNLTGTNAATYNFYLDFFVNGNDTIITPVVATPTFTPAEGTYYEAQMVSIACATVGATIHFTTDGSEPTISSEVYTTPIEVSENTTINAIAVMEGYDDSAIATATYTIQAGVVEIFNQDWEGEMNGWTFVNVEGIAVWNIAQHSGNHYANINGYNKGINIDWCISPAFNLNLYDNPSFSFRSAKNYNGPDIQVYISNDYDGNDPTTATWMELNCELSTGAFTWVESGAIDLSNFNGDNCHIGFLYTCTEDEAAAWEVDDCVLVGQTTSPIVTVTPINLNGFTYVEGHGPSAEQSFVVTGMNLAQVLTITSTEDFEISLTNGEEFDAQETIELTPSNGTIEETSIFVRMKAELGIGEYNEESIEISSEEVDPQYVVCNGSVTEEIVGQDYVRVNDLSTLNEGCQIIIAARYDTEHTNGYYVMTAATSGKPIGVECTTQMSGNDEFLPVAITNDEANFAWTVGFDGNNITLSNASGAMLGYTSSTNFATNGDNTAWMISVATASDTAAMVPGYTGFTFINANVTSRAIALNNSYNFGPYSTSNMTNGNGSGYNFYLDIFRKGQGGTPTVSAPVFTPEAGLYYEAQQVTIASATDDATIYYSTESEEGPWTEYTEAIAVEEDMTIWAYAEKADYNNSAVVSAEYEIRTDMVIIFNQDWEEDWNGWTQVSVEGGSEWTIASHSNNHYAYMNAYNDGVNEDWLISPAFDLDSYSDVVLNFRSAMNFNGPDIEVYFSNDYDGQDPTTATWQAISCNLSQGSWNWTESGEISLDAFSGNNCYIAYKYTSTEDAAAGWEIDDIMLTSGANTDPTIVATPNGLDGFNYIYEEGPSAVQTYMLTASNLEGEGEILVLVSEEFEISLDGEEFGEELDIAYADGAIIDQPVTVYVRMVEGLEIGSYEGFIMHGGGNADLDINLSGAVVSADQPSIDAFMPMYIQGNNGSNNNRVPVAVAVYFENLEANATYRYTNQFVDENDGETIAGAGNVIYANAEGFYRSTNPSLSTEGGYGEFTTDATGEGFAWIINEPTANTRFTPGNHVYLRIRLNNGHDGTAVEHIFTTEDYATVLNFGTENEENQGTAFYGKSNESAMNFVMLFSNDNDFRPTYSTSIETTGVDYANINQYANFYKEEVAGKDGYFGGILPNVNDEGINIIWVLDMESYVINDYYAEDGDFSAASSTNPQGGLDDLIFIDLTDDSVEETVTNDAHVNIWNTKDEIIVENYDNADYSITICNILGQPVMATEIQGNSTQRYSQNFAAGLYIVTLQNNDNKVSAKIIVR